MILDASKDVPAVREFLEKFLEWMKDDDRVWQMKKMLREMYQHLQDPKKDEQLEDSRKDQDLEDTKKDQELEYSRKVQKSDDSEKYQELEASKKDKKQALRKDKKLEDSKEDQELEDSKKDQLGSFMEEPESPLSIHFLMFNPEKISFFKVKRLPKRIESTDSNLLRELQASSDFTENGPPQPPQTTSYTTSYAMESVFSAEMLKLMEEECSLAELVNCSTIPTPWFLYAFEDFAAEMRNASVVDGISKNNQETETGGEDLETVQGEEGNYNQQSVKMKRPYYYVVMEALKEPSLEKSEKALRQIIIEKLLLEVVSEANPSECHNLSDSNSNAAQNVVVNWAESAPVETQQDHLSEDEESQKSDATLDDVDCTMEELTDLSGNSATSAMHEILENPTVEALADDESESVHAEHSGCNTEKTAYAPVPAEGVQPMLMHSSEGVQVPQQEEAGNDGAAGDGSVAPNPSTAIPGEIFVNSLPSSASISPRNMVGLPTCTLYTGKVKEQHKNVPVDEDSDERMKKAMDQLRKEREERVKQPTDAVKKTSDISHAVPKGLVLLSNVPHIFPEGAYVPLPSQEAMAKTIGKGGNGVVAYIYHGGREFAVKETGLRQEELEAWSSVNHRNVIKIYAAIKGDRYSACPGARRCYQIMPRITGDVKRLLEEGERPTLCHYFFDFKEDSERAGLVLRNAKYILLGVLNGLKCLHSLGIVHRDIKLQNILVNRHCQCRDIFLCPHDVDSGYGVFISDFDSALQVERGREKLERTKLHGRPIKYRVYGTDGYRPPETSFPMLCNEVLPEWLSLKTDIWSFGTMLVKFFVGSRGPHSQREMATLLLADCLQSPTAHATQKVTSPLQQALAVEPNEMKTLQKVALLEKYFPLAADLHQLVQFCLTVNVEERPNVQQVMEHAFFRPLTSDSRDTSMPDTDGRRGVGGEQSTSGLVACSNEGESLS